jgi:hypothetical protein
MWINCDESTWVDVRHNDHLKSSIRLIGEAIWYKHRINPLMNTCEFHCQSFSMTGYVMVNIGGNDIPYQVEQVNFHWDDLRLQWYKYFPMQLMASYDPPIDRISQMTVECMAGIDRRSKVLS